jgi:two-component system, NarL family, sensor histidine kinase EvgS
MRSNSCQYAQNEMSSRKSESRTPFVHALRHTLMNDAFPPDRPRTPFTTAGALCFADTRSLLTGLLRIGLAIVLAACAIKPAHSSPNFTPEELEWIDAHPVVLFATSPGSQPFNDAGDGRHQDLSTEYINAIAEITGLTFRAVDVSRWGTPTAAFSQHAIDLLPNVAYGLQSDVLQREASFSSPYMVGTSLIVTRQSQTVVFNLEKFSGKLIAVRAGGAYERLLSQRYPSIRLLSTMTQREQLDAVATGRADAAIGLNITLMPMIRSIYPNKLYASGAIADIPAVIVMATRKDLPLLASIINKSLNSLTARQVDRMTGEWLYSTDFGAPSWHSIAHYYAIEIALGAIVLAGFALLMYRIRAQYRLTADSEARKSRFIAVMSHEIRTPLNAVVSAVDLLNRSNLNPLQKQLTDTAVKASASLVSLLDDVLDISKLQAGKMQLECKPTDLGTVVESAALIMRTQADAKRLPLEVHIDAPDGVDAYIDQTRIRQILVNLLSNAIKFTEVGHVRLDAALLPEPELGVDMARIRIRVSDTGIGIPEDRQMRLFEAFEQVDSSTTRRFGGTGLGLTICKDLVTQMGGSLSLESRSGLGTTITIDLPARTEPRVVTDADTDADDATSALAPLLMDDRTEPDDLRPRVLVIEDHPLNLEVIGMQLAQLRCEAMFAATGRAGLERIARHSFDLVLLDCNLPDIDGYDVARRIRTLPRRDGSYLPIIAISALTDNAHLEACLAAGMDGVLRKPLALDELASTIDLWCRIPVAQTAPRAADLPTQASRPVDPRALWALFRNTCRDDNDMLRDALANDDAPRAATAAHRIKSAAWAMNALAIAAAAERVEQACRMGDGQARTLDDDAAELARLIAAIPPDGA